MFERKDVVPVLFLLLLIFAIIVTLSQILVVHHHNHHSTKQPRDLRKMQGMLNQLEKTVEKMIKSNVLTPSKYEQTVLVEKYKSRFKDMIEILEDKKSALMKRNEIVKRNGYSLEKERKTRNLQNTLRRISDNKKKKPNTIPRNDVVKMNGSIITLVKSTPLEHSHNRRKMKEFKSKTNFEIKQTSYLAQVGRHAYVPDSKEMGSTAEPTEQCSKHPKTLLGQHRVTTDLTSQEIHFQIAPGVQPGGHWKPSDCRALHRVAIIVPYRERKTHLDTLLFHLLPILQRQQLDFRIFVVEQFGNDTFNKGRLMNVGFAEGWKLGDFNCFIFHDVDLIPENDRNMYSCPPDNPRHMSVSVDKFNYTLPYPKLVGGVFSIRREHFIKVNGYSNLYWGWGAEDDDMAMRLKEMGFQISRPPSNVARYKMIKHNTRESMPYQWTYYLLRTLKKRFRKDGLNSLTYKVVSVDNMTTYTHIMADVGEAPKKRMNL